MVPMLPFEDKFRFLTLLLFLGLAWFPPRLIAQNQTVVQDQSLEFPTSLFQALEVEVKGFLSAEGVQVGYLPLILAEDSPLGIYYSRFLPQILLSRVPELEERNLLEQEQLQVLVRAGQRILARELEAFHTHVLQGSRTLLAGGQFTPSQDLEERAKLATQELTSSGLKTLFDQGIAWMPSRVRLSLAPPVTERSDPVPSPVQDHLRTIVGWLGREARSNTLPFPSVFTSQDPPRALEPGIVWAFSQLHTYLEQQNLSYILLGSLDFFGENNEFGIVEYWVYSSYGRSIVLSGRFNFASRSGPEVAQEESRDVALALTGQERGRVSFTTFPPTIELRVGGTTLGFGSFLWDMAPIGTHEVEFLRGSRVVRTQELVVEPDETTWVMVSIPPEPVAFVPLETNPPGAQVSFNGVGIGRTPLLVPIQSGPGILEIRSPGFHTRTLVIDQDFRQQGGNLTLLDGRIEWDTRLSQTRDRFYEALGITVLSAVVPLILNGLFGDAAVAIQSGVGSPQARASLFDQATQLFWIRNGSYLLTAVAATYTLIELQNYLRTSRAVLSR